MNMKRARAAEIQPLQSHARTAVIVPAASVFPPSRSTTRPMGLHAAYSSTQTARESCSCTTAAPPGRSTRGRGPLTRLPCRSMRQTKDASTAGTLAAWQYASHGMPRLRAAPHGSTRSCTSTSLASGA
uniref:Uncharacterized protein n=1 Tax=Emiliania huxleyi TaxID=2903 RepID=A0A7S3RYC2_EMIHU